MLCCVRVNRRHVSAAVSVAETTLKAGAPGDVMTCESGLLSTEASVLRSSLKQDCCVQKA